jgi:mRNA interferase MazF
MTTRAPLRWAVAIVDLEPVAGHEQGGRRRALVVSYEPFHRSGLATVCPITAARADGRYPGDVELPDGEAGQTRPGVILCAQVRTISIDRLARTGDGSVAVVGRLADPTLRAAVRDALSHHLGLDVPALLDGAA